MAQQQSSGIFRRIFGFAFNSEPTPNIPTPISPTSMDSSIDITAMVGGWAQPSYSAIDLDQTAKTENGLIEQYRQLSYIPEVEKAIDEIASEAIITDKVKGTVNIDLDAVENLPPKIKEVLVEEHKEVMRLLSFGHRGYEIFKRWYIDGRLNYQVLIDNENPNFGIKEMRYIDPRKIKRVRELIKQIDPVSQVEMIQGVKEYYIFSDKGVNDVRNVSGALMMTKESIVHCDSGLHDPSNNIVLSYLNSAIRPANNLRQMEDCMIIYRLARASERRVFKVYTGNLPKGKADQYVQEIANKYRNKVVYDATTGDVKTDKRYLAMTEDYWLPVGEGGQGTSIETLPGGENVGETGESDYFSNKLYKALRVPTNRMTDEPTMFSTGTEITRDEVRFSRFVSRLRTRFSGLFIETLKRNLILKGIMDEESFEQIQDNIRYEYAEDNYFSEAVEYNIITQRMSVLQLIDPYVGKYVSREYVFQNILQLTEEDQAAMEMQIEQDRQLMLMQEIEEQKARIDAGVADDPTEQGGGFAESIKEIQTPIIESTANSELDEAALAVLKKLGIPDDNHR